MRERIHLLLTVDAVGGVWQYGLDLAGALGKQGVAVTVAQMGPPPSPAQRAEFAAHAGEARLIETGLPLDWLCDGPAPVLAAGAEIVSLARDVGADLLQLNMPTLAAVPAGGLPVIAVTHGCISTWWQAARPQQPLDPAYAWHRSLMGQGLRAASRVVAPTAAYAGMIRQHYGLSRTPLTVHNGRTPPPAPTIPPCHDCVLTVGRLWDGVKGAALLDRVAARLSVPFHAAGAARGPHGETIALDNLHLLGELDAASLARRLAERPVFVSAARFEPFGLAVLEAAGAGCALVLADIPSFRELWDGTALFVDPDDEAAYIRAIETLIGDMALRLSLGDAARARALRYTPAATAEAMRTLSIETLSARPAQGKAAA